MEAANFDNIKRYTTRYTLSREHYATLTQLINRRNALQLDSKHCIRYVNVFQDVTVV